MLALWGIGDLMVIFMASLLDVPREQYEAASLDGAGAIQQFRHITLPTISPIITFAVITGVIQTMQYYTQAVIAGKVASGVVDAPGTSFDAGYPDGSTLTLPQLVYTLGFQHFNTGAACVVVDRALRHRDGVHRAAAASRLRFPVGGGLTHGTCHRPSGRPRPAGRQARRATPRRGRGTRRRKEMLQWVAVHSLAIAAALFFVLPIVFVFLTVPDERPAGAHQHAVAAELALEQLRGRVADPRVPHVVAEHRDVRGPRAPC